MHNKKGEAPHAAANEEAGLRNKDNREETAESSCFLVADLMVDTMDGCKAVGAPLHFRETVLCDPHELPVAAWWRNRLLLLGPCSRIVCRCQLSVGSNAAANVGAMPKITG